MKCETSIPVIVDFTWRPEEKPTRDCDGQRAGPEIHGITMKGTGLEFPIWMLKRAEIDKLEEECQRDYILNDRAAEDAAVNSKILEGKEKV